MNKLVNMKRAPQKPEAAPSPSMLDEPQYPYGLELRLDDEALEKIGVDVADLKVGAKLSLIANVEVTSLSSNKSKGSGENQSVSLQITDLCLDDDDSKAADATDKLYE